LQRLHPGLEPFDCVVIGEQLYWAQAPVEVLKQAAACLHPRGRVVIREPVLNDWRTFLRRLTRRRHHRGLGNFALSGVRLTTADVVARWCRGAGLEVLESVTESAADLAVAIPGHATERGLFTRWTVVSAGVAGVESPARPALAPRRRAGSNGDIRIAAAAAGTGEKR
jgi:hypothetical protein